MEGLFHIRDRDKPALGVPDTKSDVFDDDVGRFAVRDEIVTDFRKRITQIANFKMAISNDRWSVINTFVDRDKRSTSRLCGTSVTLIDHRNYITTRSRDGVSK